MNTIIGADAAKLAGLQIDTLQKVRSGQITIGQWERFNNLSTDDREARFGDWKKPEPTALAEPTEKFALLVNLGIITVPEDYNHASRLKTFRNQSSKNFYYYNDNITDKNFPKPTHVLKPGDKFRVSVFKQIVGATYEECMAFLATQKAIHTGAQGMSLVFEQRRHQLPKGKWSASFDKKDRLWADPDGLRRVPYVCCDSVDAFVFHLGDFGDVGRDDFAFLCFYKVE